MELVYDLWHLAFANLIEQRAPPNIEVQSEVRLTIEPQRADLLLIRRTGERHDERAGVLHALWPRLAKITIVEFKSPTRSSLRPGDLIRLWGYGPLYQAAHLDEAPTRGDLTLALIVPSITPTLLDEIAAMGWTLADLGGGYRRIDGAVYDLLVAVTDEVAEAERDGFLEIFSHRPVTDPQASWWLQHWIAEKRMSQKIEDVPGFEEVMQKIPPEKRLAGIPPEQRLAGIPLEQRLAGIPPEQRLAGLTEEQALMALPDEILRQLPDAYLSKLSPDIQEAVRRRIGRPRPPSA